METTFTLRDLPYTYIRLCIVTHATNGSSLTKIQQPALDEVTLRSYLNSALSQYLGLTGIAVAIEIFKVENNEAWVRLPKQDESGAVVALSQWSGKGTVTLRIQGRGSWLGALNTSVNESKLWSLET